MSSEKTKNDGDIWSTIEILKLGASKRPKNIFYCQKDKLKEGALEHFSLPK